MQAPGSLVLIAAFLLAGALAIGLAVTIAAPILAVPFFIVGFGVFLLWRGKRRANATLHQRHGDRVPSTEEAAADPVRDSGVPEATASGTAHRQRPPGA